LVFMQKDITRHSLCRLAPALRVTSTDPIGWPQYDLPRRSKRRSSITTVACQQCRKRKNKVLRVNITRYQLGPLLTPGPQCDGKRPRCSACTTRGSQQCYYDVDVRYHSRVAAYKATISQQHEQIEQLKSELSDIAELSTVQRPVPSLPSFKAMAHMCSPSPGTDPSASELELPCDNVCSEDQESTAFVLELTIVSQAEGIMSHIATYSDLLERKQLVLQHYPDLLEDGLGRLLELASSLRSKLQTTGAVSAGDWRPLNAPHGQYVSSVNSPAFSSIALSSNPEYGLPRRAPVFASGSTTSRSVEQRDMLTQSSTVTLRLPSLKSLQLPGAEASSCK